MAKPRFAQFFHGSLASLTIRPGKMESQKVISCLQACKEGLDINSLESLGRGIKVRKETASPSGRRQLVSGGCPAPVHLGKGSPCLSSCTEMVPRAKGLPRGEISHRDPTMDFCHLWKFRDEALCAVSSLPQSGHMFSV